MKLQQCLQQWSDYNSSMAQCKEWLQSIEKTVKNLDLKSSVAEKQQQLQIVEVNSFGIAVFNYFTIISNRI